MPTKKQSKSIEFQRVNVNKLSHFNVDYVKHKRRFENVCVCVCASKRIRQVISFVLFSNEYMRTININIEVTAKQE